MYFFPSEGANVWRLMSLETCGLFKHLTGGFVGETQRWKKTTQKPRKTRSLLPFEFWLRGDRRNWGVLMEQRIRDVLRLRSRLSSVCSSAWSTRLPLPPCSASGMLQPVTCYRCAVSNLGVSRANGWELGWNRMWFFLFFFFFFIPPIMDYGRSRCVSGEKKKKILSNLRQGAVFFNMPPCETLNI